MASKEQLQKFNAGRSVKDTSKLCYAPWMSLNFDQTGKVTACCFNRNFILGRYPEHTLTEIWQGKEADELRKAMEENNFDLGCQLCDKMIVDGNNESVLIKHFDRYYELLQAGKRKASLWSRIFNPGKLPPPTVFEFEISNTCNLECIMCGGQWSSGIRTNREGLTPLSNPYDENFVTQLRDFIPDLQRANFLGGEPFLIKHYQEIWEAIIELNPAMSVSITSNGTVLTDRIKKIIEALPNLVIALSIDSLQKETWESIRLNGKFETLRANIDYLLNTGKLKSFSVCPMVQNRMEIPEIVSFCEKHGLDIFFNVVIQPLGGRIEGIHQNGKQEPVPGSFKNKLVPETSLQSLPVDELEKLIDYYGSFHFKSSAQLSMNSLIQQLRVWMNR